MLSLFPGIGLLDRAFEEEGFCIVRGPDVLWGGDVRRFHPPAGVFDGVIGGDPCQPFSRIAEIARHRGFKVRPSLLGELERCIAEAKPRWFLRENVLRAPLPQVEGYIVRAIVLNNRWLDGAPRQNRLRRFAFGTLDGRDLIPPDVCLFENPSWAPGVMAGSGRAINVKIGGSGKVKATWQVKRVSRTLDECLELQGLPPDFLAEAPFTAAGRQRVIGNGVPLPMGRAIARTVKRAMGYEQEAAS